MGDELEPIADHPLQALLDRPNDDFSRAATLRLIAGHLVLVGEAYVLKVRAQGLRRPGAERNIPTELWMMHPARTSPALDGGRVSHYLVMDGNGKQQPIEKEDVIRFWMPDVESLYGSRGYLGPQASSVDADKFSDQTVRAHFMHDAVPRVVIEGKDDAQMPQPAQLEAWFAQWRGAYDRRVGSRRGLPAWLPTGFSIHELTAMGGMSELVPLKNHYRDKVLMAFGVPRSIVGDVVDANRAAAETNQYVFDLHTISPITNIIAESLTHQLAPDFGEGLVVRFEDFVVSDKDFELRQMETDLRTKVRVINEVREERGEDEVAWGDLPVGSIADTPYTGEEPEPYEPFEPEPEDDDEPGVSTGKGFNEASAITASSVLNGAQVQAITTLMMQVAQGLVPRDSAIELMGVAFGIEAATAAKILPPEGSVDADEIDEPRCRAILASAGFSFSHRALRPAPPEVRAEWEREQNAERKYVPTFDKGLRGIFGVQERQILKTLRTAGPGRQIRALNESEIKGILYDLLGGPDAFTSLFEQRVERYRRKAFERMGQEAFESIFEQVGLDAPVTFQYTTAAAANLARQAKGFRQSVNQTTLKRLSKDVTAAIAEGMAQGESSEQVAKRVEQAVKGRMVMQRQRSRVIARTEMGIATSQAKLNGWQQSGIVAGKRWHTSLDDAVRDSHIPMEGQTVALGVPFVLPDTGEQADAPRVGVDGTRLSAHNAIGCRCFTSAVLDIGES